MMDTQQAQALAQQIIESNTETVIEWIMGAESGSHFDGTCYQLYLDVDDDSLSIHQEASSQSWLRRDDGSLQQVARHEGYDDRPEDECTAQWDDLDDPQAALDMLADQIAERLIWVAERDAT